MRKDYIVLNVYIGNIEKRKKWMNVARSYGLSVSEFIRRAVDYYIDRIEEMEEKVTKEEELRK